MDPGDRRDVAAGHAPRLRVGDPAPDFRLEAADGRTVGLADYRGRRVLLWLSRGIY